MRRDVAVHMPALDGARGIAILLVLICHGGQQWRLPRLFEPIAWGGWAGVDLFFVISGFLITGILLRGRGAPRGLARFWIRRALRIFPLAYAVLFACYVLSRLGATGFAPLDASTWAWFALYGGNLYVMLYRWPLIAQVSVMWSLAIEEQFYFVWPFVARFAPRWAIVLVALALVVSAPLVRAALWPEYQGYGTAFTLGRTDGLALGSLLALAHERPNLREWVSRVSNTIAIPALVVGMSFATERLGEPVWFVPYRMSVVAFGFVPLVAASAEPGRFFKRLLGQRWLRWMGERSYGLYLLHFLLAPAYTALTAPWLDGGIASIVGWILCVSIAAELSFRLFERPLLNLRPRLEARLVAR